MTNAAPVIEAVLQTLLTGLMTGCIYGVMATGVGVIFGIMRVVNFAQGEFLMVAMYAAVGVAGLLGASMLAGATVNAYLAAFAVGPLMFVFGLALHRLFLSRITGMRAIGVEGEGHFAQMILTLGISLIMQNLALAAFGAVARQNRAPVSDEAWMLTPFASLDVAIFINKAQMISSLLAALAAAGVFLFLAVTPVGKALRAAADNPMAATFVGISVERAHRFAFAFGTAITAIAGGLVAVYFPFHPYIGGEFLVIMYAAVVLGGLGSLPGAFWGGLIIGLVQQVSALFVPLELQSAAIFAVFLAVLLVRPGGLFGADVERV